MFVRIIKGKPTPDSKNEKFIINIYQNGTPTIGIAADYLCFESFQWCSTVKNWEIDLMYIEAVEVSTKLKPKEENRKEFEIYALIIPLNLRCECSPP